MKSVLIAAGFGLAISILLTPLAIKAFRTRGFGQEIRDDGPESHLSKKGTPTMGGTVIVGATVAGYLIAHLFLLNQPGRGVTASGVLLLLLMVGLGTVGFLDDYLKIRHRRSLGLNKTAKLVGQLLVGVVFAVLALQFESDGVTPASTNVSFVRDIAPLALGSVGFVILAYLFIAGFSNAVNLTDGLDGLAAGCSAMVFASYVIISFWQFGHDCSTALAAGCYEVRDPIDVTLVAAAAMGACLGFLWWNTSPARIFMGDTGSLALGGLMAGLAIVTRTELLLVVLGGLFVAVTMSVVIQVAFFRATRRRVFRMAPLHHHFELAGWAENTVIVRFWLLTGMAVAFGMGLFYTDWLSFTGL
ncbi:phospho-N-acetylmuramoyl-pentapeptide-transferase [Modestobacter sp. I12A-02628]|uniref:Phospho-N-acetylmuramoyl-pentapeptide-transferase n=1 Tax=Goekera deserti TaxID=2497753 RepID=A0A7K3WD37_9ACTN|nr:phospho-N-acetylmuramoyl-pentapeptide-transferase [Goekera deserti]MPQ97721.1 phospho-N-acetylmuramoyl-pentapeptide-transferase [Goekera deserti]NDI47612.1 phospho-N-acetylmuramoyl-pentapeptide-transferase [Goekera deserti]NDI47675.1 phospho-N-acetylmuramoyl-pentapeptide-transferase [Goekera deserti]NEL53423.1 phospho-N-acetylmuramoyl-pentapeptide-transferase [Goekera deserti]